MIQPYFQANLKILYTFIIQQPTCSETTQEAEQTEAEQDVYGVLNRTEQSERTEEGIWNNSKFFLINE